MNEDEKYFTSMAMIEYGGGFVHHLGHALAHADMTNRQRIKSAFPELCQQYYEMGKNDPKFK